MPSQTDAIQQAIAAAKDKIHSIDMSITGATVGVAQAIDELKAALDKIDTCLSLENIHKASSIGYDEVASGFVFVQRAIAGLQDAYYAKENLISDIVMQSGAASYEQVEPFVNEAMGTAKTLTAEERAEHEAFLAKDVQDISRSRIKLKSVRAMHGKEHDFMETVMARVSDDPEFQAALLAEGMNLLLAGDIETGKTIIKTYIEATVGFESLANAIGIPAKNLLPMFGDTGDPTAAEIFAIISYLQKTADMYLTVRAAINVDRQIPLP
jgi:hypothetical protein